MDQSILLPSKPRIVSEKDHTGIFEIDGLYPGYGYTLGNSLRRIILSSLPGAAVTLVKIAGIDHEFSTISGVKEDVITILLRLKQMRMKVSGDGAHVLTLKVKGSKEVTAQMIKAPGQVEIINTDLHLCTLTDSSAEIDMEITVERGLGFVTKEARGKDKVDIGSIALDAVFTPVRRVSYEVENMRVGERTDFNRLKISIDTDGTITPKEALEKSIEIMINQLKAIVGFKEEEISLPMSEEKSAAVEPDEEVLKTRIENLNFSVRTMNALANANIRTVGGLARKKEKDILDIEGMGSKGLSEIKAKMREYGITLK